jgi:hypothetical protein
MASQMKLPYLASPGVIPKILGKIQEARRPDRFTQDFLETKLGQSGGSARAMIPLLKRMEFLASDGTPTRLYDRFRNPSTSGAALAMGIKSAYSEVFYRNTYANDLTRDKFKNLILEMTGLEKDNSVANLIVSTFWILKTDADFEGSLDDENGERAFTNVAIPIDPPPATSNSNGQPPPPPPENQSGVDFRIGYTINLNLPESTNVEVFNAIFRALNDNLLRRP